MSFERRQQFVGPFPSDEKLTHGAPSTLQPNKEVGGIFSIDFSAPFHLVQFTMHGVADE